MRVSHKRWPLFGLLLIILLAMTTQVWAGQAFVTGPAGLGAGQQTWTEERMRSAVAMDRPVLSATQLSGESSAPVAPQTFGPVQSSPSNPGPDAVSTLLGSDPTLGTEIGNNGARPCPASEYVQFFSSTTVEFPERAIGRLYFETGDGYAGWCTASVISENVIVTAGHCVSAGDGRWYTNFMFIPGYDSGAEPFGRWSGWRVGTFPTWHLATDFTRDVGMIQILDRDGQKVGEMVGWLGLAVGLDPAGRAWDQYGYPAELPFSGEQLSVVQSPFGYSDTNSGVLPYPLATGNNMTGGSSGGPWINSFDGRFLYVNGLNSYGYESCDETMYSPYFDAAVWDLFLFMSNQ